VPTVAVVVIAYDAASTIGDVLDRLPSSADGGMAVLVADDASTDDTAAVARAWVVAAERDDVDVVRRPRNLGYGGNQIAGYQWAIDVGATVVASVHGDGQYPPELVTELVAPILAGESDAVFGSRMLDRGGARRGGMPATRRVGNRVLSAAQNRLTGAALSEWHSGFRAYRVETLREIDLATLPRGFDFDTAITLRLLRHGARLAEIPIPTRYGDEVSHIRLWRTGAAILVRTIRYRLDRPEA
jgi:glycosyltransferase involved in cell wall biosynthesis